MCDSWPPAVHIQIIILPLLPARAGAGQLELGSGCDRDNSIKVELRGPRTTQHNILSLVSPFTEFTVVCIVDLLSLV